MNYEFGREHSIPRSHHDIYHFVTDIIIIIIIHDETYKTPTK